MVFDYRIIKTKECEFMIGEVFYDDEDSEDIVYWCPNPIECWGEDLERLNEEIQFINEAFEKPILEEIDEDKLVEMV